jgi:hypothetical protein
MIRVGGTGRRTTSLDGAAACATDERRFWIRGLCSPGSAQSEKVGALARVQPERLGQARHCQGVRPWSTFAFEGLQGGDT